MCLSIRQTFFSLFPLVRDFCGRTPGRIFSSFFRFGDGHVCVRTIKVFPNTTIISVLVILIILSVYYNQFFFLLSFFSATSAKTTTSFFSSSLSS